MSYIILTRVALKGTKWTCLPKVYASRTTAEEAARKLTIKYTDNKYVVRNVSI